MIVGTDARKRRVDEGHTVIDDRGRAWEVLSTEKTLRKQRLARVQSVPTTGSPGKAAYSLVRLYLTFRVAKPSPTAEANKRRWANLYQKHVRPIQRAAAKRRRALTTQPLRKCPACMDSDQPVRFKLGVQVWKGKKLRVCSLACAQTVRKEVTALQRKRPRSGRERLRRHIAGQYMRKGGQG